MITHPALKLSHFSFPELFHAEGLKRLDDIFLAQLSEVNTELYQTLLRYREEPHAFSAIETSDFLIACSLFLQDFLADLFQIEEAVAISQAHTTSFNPLSTFKKYFVLRRAKKEMAKAATLPSFTELNAWLQQVLANSPLQSDDTEMAIALLGKCYLAEPDLHQADIEKLVAWCTQALASPEGAAFVSGWSTFHLPARLDYAELVQTAPLSADAYQRFSAPKKNWRLRDGFKLTDPRMNAREVQDQVNYCIYCHDHDGDLCSKGFPEKKSDNNQNFKKNPLNVTLTGCPLEEKISEMNLLKKEGQTLAALAMVMVDNPMCPATGHRICNDCMKSCIYQKQEPVNIPQIETRVLTDVLDLPWGVEIYDLLTRWNPLRPQQWVMKPYNGKKIMIAGMGPAGFTLAHHLLLEGFAIVGFDGLKIEPLPEALITQPIYRFADLHEALDERLMAGFGGVAEYGITVRWDKNFLKLIYLSLMRKPHFQVFGNVRFGGTVTVQDAFKMGFDHFVVAVGAGLPKALPIPGSLAPGMRQANDFLMALQLGNAAKSSSLTNLQIRLPAVVIGGGLTGVDTATELQAYYLTQVEKIYHRYHLLKDANDEETIHQTLDPASREILEEYLTHGKAVHHERKLAAIQNRAPDFLSLIHKWGGVTIAYRRSMQESPAYINNHEELQKALEEGIYYLEGVEPIAVDLNEHGYSEVLICHRRIQNNANEWIATTEEIRLPARSILVATGTQPNTAYEFEHRGTFNRVNLQYQHYEDYDGELTIAHGVNHCKDPMFGPFTSYIEDDHRVSLVGDTHPVFHGSVVKAIASGMRTYPKILAILKDQLGKLGDLNEYQHFANEMTTLFSARVHQISRLTEQVIQLEIKAPLAAHHFKPGQFYRLQNFETYAPRLDHTLLQMEPLALAVASCDKEQNLLRFIVTEDSASAKLCATLKPGEPVSLMGPTGARAKTPSEHETILIIGNQTSFSLLLSYGHALREAKNRVIYVATLSSSKDIYCREEIETVTDHIVWITAKDHITSLRKQDDALMSDQAIITLADYVNEKIPGHKPHFLLRDVDRIYVVGDALLLKQFQAARHTSLKEHLIKDPKVLGAVYGNMQCMLKGVCAQCLQWQIDPETGHRTKAVFACSWQDQPLEIIDIDHMAARAQQNRLLEKLSLLWVDYLFKHYAIDRV